jgi:hypothetical protein
MHKNSHSAARIDAIGGKNRKDSGFACKKSGIAPQQPPLYTPPTPMLRNCEQSAADRLRTPAKLKTSLNAFLRQCAVRLPSFAAGSETRAPKDISM